MKTGTTFTFFLLSLTMAGFILLPGSSFAQQKTDSKENGKKTVTIQITTETDGKMVKIDTTFVSDGDFDEDAFLKEKGILTEVKEDGNVEKKVIIRHPESKQITYTESDGNSPDTIIISDGRVIILKDKNDEFDMPAIPPYHGMPNNFNMQGFPPMQSPGFEHMLEGMVRSMGLDNMMPFGELDNIVVKKKRNGKKVIITFDDRDKESCKPGCCPNNQEKVFIYRNGEQGMAPQNEERYVIEGEQGEKIIINKNVETKGTENIVTIKADVDKSTPVKQEKKIVIIKETDIK